MSSLPAGRAALLVLKDIHIYGSSILILLICCSQKWSAAHASNIFSYCSITQQDSHTMSPKTTHSPYCQHIAPRTTSVIQRNTVSSNTHHGHLARYQTHTPFQKTWIHNKIDNYIGMELFVRCHVVKERLKSGWTGRKGRQFSADSIRSGRVSAQELEHYDNITTEYTKLWVGNSVVIPSQHIAMLYKLLFIAWLSFVTCLLKDA